MKTLVIVTDFSKASLEAIGAAKAMGPFTLGVIGAAEAPSVGAEKVLGVAGEAFTQARYATDAAAAEALVKAAVPELVLAPQNSRLARALPGVAQRVGGVVDTHVTAIAADGTTSRSFYRQRIETTFTRAARPWIVLLESGCAEAVAASGTVAAEPVAAAADTRTTVTGVTALASDQQTIRPDANLLFVAGAGWTKKQKDGATKTPVAADLILQFVQGARASLGSSKSLVDLSGEGHAVLPFLTHLHQVGQTGSTPRHPKGLATCCHGEEPHVVGWRFIGERRAVNLDANCGWARGKADVLYVADAFEVMREVNALLTSRSNAAGA